METSCVTGPRRSNKCASYTKMCVSMHQESATNEVGEGPTGSHQGKTRQTSRRLHIVAVENSVSGHCRQCLCVIDRVCPHTTKLKCQWMSGTAALCCNVRRLIMRASMMIRIQQFHDQRLEGQEGRSKKEKGRKTQEHGKRKNQDGFTVKKKS